MRKLKHVWVLAAAGMALVAVNALAHGNEHGTAKATIGSVEVTIDYARPMLKGRDFTKMIQPGGVWRIGADVPTTIDSDADLDFGGTRVSKGKHILLAHYLEPGKWTLLVSSKSAAQYEPGAKLAEVPMEVQEGQDPVEEMTIRLSAKNDKQGVIEISWGSARLTGSFSVAR